MIAMCRNNLTGELPLFKEELSNANSSNTTKHFDRYFVREFEDKSVCYPFLYEIHYAKRKPALSHVFGLYNKHELVGVCTYGMPANPNLCFGIAGHHNRESVIELNRLVLKYNLKNEASYLVGHSIKMLPKPKIIVSYADTGQRHLGVVYQATNFLFTGTTKARTDMASKGGKHSRHSLGDPAKRVNRTAKHRYVFIHGDKRQKKQILKDLKYPTLTYPKQEDAL